MRVLIVDDEPSVRRVLGDAVEAMGHSVEPASSSAEALRRIERRPCDAALVDLRLGSDSGLDLMGRLKAAHPRLLVVIITAHASIGTAVEAIRRGASEYLPKPFTPGHLRSVLEKLPWPSGSADDETVAAELESPDPLMKRLLHQARVVAATDAVVLIRGESGTGKGALARALHAWSKQAGGAFVTVSSPSLGPDLLESDLFGHVRGAFTGAVRDVLGKVAVAEGGTLFLDEVGDMPLALQPKLLRFLQERRYERLGEAVTRSSRARLVAATNRDLESAVASGLFRDDLLYRLNTVELTLPPLRERKDILDLAARSLASFALKAGRPIDGFSEDARDALARYRWPGNLRELRNVIERAVILADGRTIGVDDLPERVASPDRTLDGPVEVGRRVSLERLEREHIRRVLADVANVEEAARILGINRSTLYRKRRGFHR